MSARSHVRRPLSVRFWEKVRKTDGCWVWEGGAVPRGYGIVWVGSGFECERRTEYTHRLAWQMTFGPIPPKAQVCHKCDNPPCVRPEHLFLGTAKDNSADMIAKGRSARGDKMPQTKMTPEKIEWLRRMSGDTRLSQADAAWLIGISPAQACRILGGSRWEYLTAAEAAS